MSDYKKGNWTDIWDGLFWKFLKKHKKEFEKNMRTKVLLSHLEKHSEIIERKILIAKKKFSDK